MAMSDVDLGVCEIEVHAVSENGTEIIAKGAGVLQVDQSFDTYNTYDTGPMWSNMREIIFRVNPTRALEVQIVYPGEAKCEYCTVYTKLRFSNNWVTDLPVCRSCAQGCPTEDGASGDGTIAEALSIRNAHEFDPLRVHNWHRTAGGSTLVRTFCRSCRECETHFLHYGVNENPELT